MKTKIDSYNTITKRLKTDYPQLTDFEALKPVIQIKGNQILENGLVVSTDDLSPTGLETIAITLEYTSRMSSITITSLFQSLVEKNNQINKSPLIGAFVILIPDLMLVFY
ncbi:MULTISPECIES: hypothetical protein [Myroides]|uniref:Uncharacterized protein n=1 Tax=Myroides profundi TaxID=480520 RepID=A0AAJ4W6T6_MYRPR|nr:MULTISPECIES: hypothetical protein [Myroides]AJH15360.1 histidine kinase [Myroides profundi]SER56004.1 hypothetical protein SAMN04488089_11919 [Myroides profundi]SHM53994.1 hypothetical protein SAMN05444275_11532 [Myroides odoratimimus subsp. xuanwuensis]